RELLPDLLRVGVIVGETHALDGDVDWRWGAETHYLADDVGGFEGHLHAGNRRADALAEGFAAGRFGTERDLDDGLLRAGGEEMDQVDRIVGRDDADKVGGHGDIVRAGLASDSVDGAEDHPLGLLDAGSGGRAQPNPKERGVGVGKELRG